MTNLDVIVDDIARNKKSVPEVWQGRRGHNLSALLHIAVVPPPFAPLKTQLFRTSSFRTF